MSNLIAMKSKVIPRSTFGLIERMEDNDCTVRALVHAFDLEYETAWKLCLAHGRKPLHGFNITGQLIPALRVQDHSQWIKGMRLNDVLLRIPSKGRYLVLIDRHIFAVKDGFIYDLMINRNTTVYALFQCFVD